MNVRELGLLHCAGGYSRRAGGNNSVNF